MGKIKKLQALKEKMLSLQSGDFDVEAENPKVVKCWERLDCEKTDCPAYGKLRCWSIAGTSCRGEVQGEFAQKLGDCRKCVVYRESCGDEISEFIEVFNQMVKDIKFNISEQEKSGKKQAENERLAELGNMIAAVAHETRNPLHSIGMAASYLKKNFHGELVSEFLNIIEEEVNKLNTLTTVFLSFSHPEPLSLVSGDLNRIVRETVERFLRTYDIAGNAITLKLADIPNIPCDRDRISEAVTRLLENSLESSPDNPTITVSTAETEKGVRITVQDNGPGIQEKDRENIFKPFFTTKTNGPGLGLSIVKRTVREHRGAVHLEESSGNGAVFSIDLPVETGPGMGANT